MTITIKRGETVAIFALLFIVVGAIAPMVYIGVAPESHFIEVHNFTAEDIHVSAEEHNVYIDRTVRRPADAEVVVEMQLLREDGRIVEEDSFTVDAYVQQGRREVIVPRKIDEETTLEPGTYRYVDAVTLSYYGGWADRSFVYVSDNFTVYENKSKDLNSGST